MKVKIEINNAIEISGTWKHDKGVDEYEATNLIALELGIKEGEVSDISTYREGGKFHDDLRAYGEFLITK